MVTTVYSQNQPTCVNAVSNDDNKDGIEDSLRDFKPAVIICAVAYAIQMLFQNVLISGAYFKEMAIGTVAIQFGVGLILALIGWQADSLTAVYVGSTTVPAVVLALGFIWYVVRYVKPAQDLQLVQGGHPKPPLICCTACAKVEQCCCPCCFRDTSEDVEDAPLSGDIASKDEYGSDTIQMKADAYEK